MGWNLHAKFFFLSFCWLWPIQHGVDGKEPLVDCCWLWEVSPCPYRKRRTHECISERSQWLRSPRDSGWRIFHLLCMLHFYINLLLIWTQGLNVIHGRRITCIHFWILIWDSFPFFGQGMWGRNFEGALFGDSGSNGRQCSHNSNLCPQEIVDLERVRQAHPRTLI